MRTSLSSLAVIAAASFLAVSGCAGTRSEISESPEQKESQAVQQKVVDAQKLALDSKYPEAVSAYRLVLHEHPNTAWAAEAKYGIALAYVSADNPQKDYTAAIAEFDEPTSLFIVNLSGKTVYRDNLTPGELTRQIDITESFSGNYILIISCRERILSTTHFIKN